MISAKSVLTAEPYRGLRCIVTGGLGFIGSNMAVTLATAGARVTLIDCAVPGCGANPINLAGISDSIRVLNCDIGENR